MSIRKNRDVLDELHLFDVDKANRIIYVHGDVNDSESIEIDYRIASKFIKNLNYLESLSTNEITIKMLVPGGDWSEGMAMYDAISQSKCYITTISYSYACSMSSIIIQAADHRIISKHADFMIHYGTYGSDGDYRAVANGLEYYKRSNDIMFDIYANRCLKGEYAVKNNMDVKSLKEFFKHQVIEKTDWWMSSDEALYYGFVDEII